MNKEEAIEYIQEWLKDEYALNGKDRVVLNMAIEALSADAVQGCDGCRHILPFHRLPTRTPQKQCLRCKRYWKDRYERKGGDDE